MCVYRSVVVVVLVVVVVVANPCGWIDQRERKIFSLFLLLLSVENSTFVLGSTYKDTESQDRSFGGPASQSA